MFDLKVGSVIIDFGSVITDLAFVKPDFSKNKNIWLMWGKIDFVFKLHFD